MAGEREDLTFRVTELEEGVTLETGKEYHLTEEENRGRLAFRLLDEAGDQPHKDQAFELTGPNDFEASGTSDAEGAYEHPEPLPCGDYVLIVGGAQRWVHPQGDESPAHPLAIAHDEIEGGQDLPHSPEDPQDDEDEVEDEAPLLEIERESGPATLYVDAELVLAARLTPPALEGTYTWSAGGSAATLTPVESSPHLATLKGVQACASMQISCAFTPSAAGISAAEAVHELAVHEVEVREADAQA